MSLTIRLDERVAIVTGAGGGLGRAMAIGLADAGAKVVMVDVDKQALLSTHSAQEFRANENRIARVECDITNKPDCERAVREAVDRFGRLDILVNNAGRGPNHVIASRLTRSMKFWEADPDRWGDVIRTNVVGSFLMAHAAAPPMIRSGWGRIINITTSLPTMQRRENSPYGVSKAAIEAETLIWAQDLADTGVTVNSLIPGGAADTEFVSPHTRAAAQAGTTKLLPPEIMNPPLLWLASNLSDGVTGARFVGKLWDSALGVEEAVIRAREAPVLRSASR